MSHSPPTHDERYIEALASVENTIAKLQRCSTAEKARLHKDFRELAEMVSKLRRGHLEIVVFGEISTGKSALINALVGDAVAEVDVRGGWTQETWHVPWKGSGYAIPGFAESTVVLIDTPGLNEVGGVQRGNMASDAARKADLILFVTDSDLNETEHSALVSLAALHKTILLVLNKVDLYTKEQQARLVEILQKERTVDLVPADRIISASADPREKEFLIESADGSIREMWRKPAPDVANLKASILELLSKDGLALIALNAALYSADKSDRIASMRIELRRKQASQTVWSYAALKSIAVAANSVPIVDSVCGVTIDATMVVTLAHIYGLEMSWLHARKLVVSILKAAGMALLAETSVNVASWIFKALTVGFGTIVTAVPQGAAAGYGSYIVGQAATFYFEHGASWGGESPKQIVRKILEDTDKQSVLNNLKDEIKHAIRLNPHAKTPTE